MILVIVIVNTSEFAYFFFKSGESHEGRHRLLVLLSPGGFRIEQFVTNCGVEGLPCNCLFVSSVTFMSAVAYAENFRGGVWFKVIWWLFVFGVRCL